MEVKIRLANSTNEVPLELLLLADPSEEKIRSYIHEGSILVAESQDEVVGVVVLIQKDDKAIEIVNIAVREDVQGKGIGKKLIHAAIQFAKKQKAISIEIGTGNSSLAQLGIYQRCGFRIIEIWHDYFIDNYDEDIYENGIRCRDMIRLKIDL